MLACVLVLTGCSDLEAQLSGERSSEPAGRSAPPAPLVTESWGTVDGLLSVVVRNPTQRILRSATATITATDDDGATVGSSKDTAVACCAVADLPPGAAYGFYLDVGEDADAVADVEVSYRDVAWHGATAATPPPAVATPVGLQAGPLGASVLADVSTPRAGVAQAVVQAHLVTPDGTFLAVISGRWSCFTAGGSRRIEMQLFHPVPAGTEVESVMVYPDTTPAQPAPACPA